MLFLLPVLLQLLALILALESQLAGGDLFLRGNVLDEPIVYEGEDIGDSEESGEHEEYADEQEDEKRVRSMEL